MASLNDLFAPACSLYKELESVAKELGSGWYFSGSGSSFFRIDSTANLLESTFSCGDSVLSRHSADFGDLEATADLKSSSAPKSPKNSKSPTAKQATAVQGEAAAGFFRNPRILEEEIQAECEKSTANKKVDSSDEAFLSSLRALRQQSVAKQGEAAASLVIHKNITENTQALESTFLNNTQKSQSVASLEKVDSRIFDKNAEFLKVDSRKQAQKVETSQNTRAESVFDNKPQGTL